MTVLEAASAPLLRVLGPCLADWFAELHRAEGVEVTGSRLATRLAACAVVLALAGLAAFTIFSGPTTIELRAPTSKP